MGHHNRKKEAKSLKTRKPVSVRKTGERRTAGVPLSSVDAVRSCAPSVGRAAGFLSVLLLALAVAAIFFREQLRYKFLSKVDFASYENDF